MREARAVGVQNLGLDVMAGLPGQTSTITSTRSRSCSSSSDRPRLGLRAHPVPPRAAAPRGLRPAPAELTEVLQAGAEALLRARGLPQYEVSNFAPPDRRSRHNALVWAGWPYLGLGASAHSMWSEGAGTLRRANADLPPT